MPQLGETVTEGKVATWFKSVGDAVAAGDNLFEIETDKVTMEVQATSNGVLAEIRVPAGETVPVGTIVAVLGAKGEALAQKKSNGAAAASARPPLEPFARGAHAGTRLRPRRGAPGPENLAARAPPRRRAEPRSCRHCRSREGARWTAHLGGGCARSAGRFGAARRNRPSQPHPRPDRDAAGRGMAHDTARVPGDRGGFLRGRARAARAAAAVRGAHRRKPDISAFRRARGLSRDRRVPARQRRVRERPARPAPRHQSRHRRRSFARGARRSGRGACRRDDGGRACESHRPPGREGARRQASRPATSKAAATRSRTMAASARSSPRRSSTCRRSRSCRSMP